MQLFSSPRILTATLGTCWKCPGCPSLAYRVDLDRKKNAGSPHGRPRSAGGDVSNCADVLLVTVDDVAQFVNMPHWRRPLPLPIGLCHEQIIACGKFRLPFPTTSQPTRLPLPLTLLRDLPVHCLLGLREILHPPPKLTSIGRWRGFQGGNHIPGSVPSNAWYAVIPGLCFTRSIERPLNHWQHYCPHFSGL